MAGPAPAVAATAATVRPAPEVRSGGRAAVARAAKRIDAVRRAPVVRAPARSSRATAAGRALAGPAGRAVPREAGAPVSVAAAAVSVAADVTPIGARAVAVTTVAGAMTARVMLATEDVERRRIAATRRRASRPYQAPRSGAAWLGAVPAS